MKNDPRDGPRRNAREGERWGCGISRVLHPSECPREKFEGFDREPFARTAMSADVIATTLLEERKSVVAHSLKPERSKSGGILPDAFVSMDAVDIQDNERLRGNPKALPFDLAATARAEQRGKGAETPYFVDETLKRRDPGARRSRSTSRLRGRENREWPSPGE